MHVYCAIVRVSRQAANERGLHVHRITSDKVRRAQRWLHGLPLGQEGRR